MIVDPIIRDIPEYPNYQISENGEVYNKKNGNEIFGYVTNDGYRKITAINNEKNKSFTIHRILAIIFIDNPLNKEVVDHINGDRSNNYLSNLRWATKAENGMNSILKPGKSGHRGINKVKTKYASYWNSEISKKKDRQRRYFPYTEEGLQDAITWRKIKEIELYGEFAPN